VLPDTELNVLVTDPNGTTKTFDSNASDPADRPRGIQFGTQLQSGFSDAGFELRRAIDRDNTDIGKLDDVKFIGVNGETAYEGYVGTLPRSMDEKGHSLAITTAGWIAHAADESFTAIFVDRDLGAWGPAGRARRIAVLGGGTKPFDPTTHADPTSGTGVLTLQIADTWSASGVNSEAWYDAGPSNQIGSIYYEWTKNGAAFGVLPGAWTWSVFVSADDNLGSLLTTGNLAAAGPGAATFTPSEARRFAMVFFASSGPAGAAGSVWEVDWSNIAVYGDQGLRLIGSANPLGVAASDVITYLANRYAPMLDTSDVKQTTWPISHLVFRESTKPYDAFLKVNSYHLWKLGVWEKRKLCFAPIDLTDWDWEIRHDEMGNTIGLQGDSIEDLRNGIIVQFTNVKTGAVERLTPDVYTELRDTSVDNPANTHGRRMWGDPYTIPFPTTLDDALQLGRAKLALDNQPKAPGSFTAQHCVRDRAGNPQPAWKVRAGDRIRLTSTANISDRPRLIHETRYTHDSRSVTISVDATAQVLEAIIDRQQTARQAAGLS
jgi:hypothetical protein